MPSSDTFLRMNGKTVRGQIDAAGQSAGRDGAETGRGGEDRRQRLATDGIDTAGPALRREGRSFFRKRGAVDDGLSAEVAKIIVIFGTACRRRNFVAELVEQKNGYRADASGRAGDNYLAIDIGDVEFFECHYREHGGEPRCSDGHGLERVERLRDAIEGVGGDALHLRKSAPARFA